MTNYPSAYQVAKSARLREWAKKEEANNILQFPSVEIEQSKDTLQLEKKLARYLDLKDKLSEINSEYKSLSKELKIFFEGMPEAYISDYKVTGKYRDMPAREMAACQWWDMKVRKI